MNTSKVYLPNPEFSLRLNARYEWSDLEALGIKRTQSNDKPEHWYTAAHEVELPLHWSVRGSTNKWWKHDQAPVIQFFPRWLLDPEKGARVAITLRLHKYDNGRDEPLCVLAGGWKLLPRYDYIPNCTGGITRWEVIDRKHNKVIFDPANETVQSPLDSGMRYAKDPDRLASEVRDWLIKHYPQYQDHRAYW